MTSFSFDDLAFNFVGARRFCPDCNQSVAVDARNRCESCERVLPPPPEQKGGNNGGDPILSSLLADALAPQFISLGGAGGNRNMAEMLAAQQNVNIEQLMQQLLSESGNNAPPTSKAFLKDLLTRPLVEKDFLQLCLVVEGLPRPFFPTGASFGPSLLAKHVFGGEVAQTHVAATLIACQPPEGHTALTNAEELKGNVAWMRRGKVTFVAKSRLAQKSGASAVIIAQTDDVWPYVAGDAAKEGGDITIPVVMVSQKDAAALDKFISDVRKGLVLAPRTSAPATAAAAAASDSTANTAGNAPSTATPATAGATASAATNSSSAESTVATAASDSKATSAPVAAVRKLDSVRVKLFTQDKKLACPVCRDDFALKDEAVRLPCNHYFHLDTCLLPWLEKRNTCPLCRHELPTEQKPRGNEPDGNQVQMQRDMFT